MKNLSGKQLCRLLEKNGWELKRVNGSHHIYMKHGRVERISVPVHANSALKKGLLQSLLKVAEI